jgi:hypothetical protein
MLEALKVRYAADGSGGVAHDGKHQRLPGWGCIKGAHTKFGGAWRQGRLDDFLIEAVALWRQRHSVCTLTVQGGAQAGRKDSTPACQASRPQS